MNRHEVEGKFDQLKGAIKRIWGNLTDDDIMLYNGDRDKFYGKLEEKYGLAQDEAENRLKELKKLH
jgi:uncharacterized protein YjbJ (UPF0337 family)